jgi:hypothetical protein
MRGTKEAQWGAAGNDSSGRTLKEVFMKTNKDTILNLLRLAIAGIQKHFASVPTIVLGGQPTTPNAFVATLQGAIDAIGKAAAAETAFHDAVTAQNAALATGKASLKALHELVTSQLGSTAAILGDFGMTNPARQVPTQEVKAAAVAKRAATRAARGTKGARQKAGIKGQVPATPAPPTKPA